MNGSFAVTCDFICEFVYLANGFMQLCTERMEQYRRRRPMQQCTIVGNKTLLQPPHKLRQILHPAAFVDRCLLQKRFAYVTPHTCTDRANLTRNKCTKKELCAYTVCLGTVTPE